MKNILCIGTEENYKNMKYKYYTNDNTLEIFSLKLIANILAKTTTIQFCSDCPSQYDTIRK